jgi:uncharacterized membrane protein YccC
MIPLVLGACGLLTPTEAVLASFAGHAIGALDVRGAYTLRLSFLMATAMAFTGAAWLGSMVGHSLLLAVLASGFIALGAGAWRHGLGEYGPAVASPAALLFFIALATGRAAAPPMLVMASTMAGCLLCIAFHALSWPFMAQHPLRRAVAGSWTALADLAEALPVVEGVEAARRQERVEACEHNLRAALDQANLVLAGAPGRGIRPLLKELEDLNLEAAHLATQLMALHPTLDRLGEPPGPGPLAASFRSVLASLVNTCRSLSVAVVSHQAGHLAKFEVRAQRLDHHVRVLRGRAAAKLGDSPEGAHLADVLRGLQDQLPPVRATLRAAMERAQERGPISFELFDLKAWTLRPLASALNFSFEVDPALVRFTFRLAVMMMAGTFAWLHWRLPHGYWIPLCVMVVLQPDYGATRARATQRAVGTIAGVLTGSLLLWLHLPLWLLFLGTAATCWAFTFYLKRNYAMAVFFITLLVVLQFQASGPVTLELTTQRLIQTMGGCVLALLGALTFWPMWERDRFPPLLAEALRANRDFLDWLALGLEGDPQATPALVLKAKRKVQRANSLVFSSLNRMAGDPDVKQEGIERLAALANHNLRITRGLSVAAVHFRPGSQAVPGIRPTVRVAMAALEALADVVEGGCGPAMTSHLARPRARLEDAALPVPCEPRTAWVTAQLELVVTELSAMLVEHEGEAA